MTPSFPALQRLESFIHQNLIFLFSSFCHLLLLLPTVGYSYSPVLSTLIGSLPPLTTLSRQFTQHIHNIEMHPSTAYSAPLPQKELAPFIQERDLYPFTHRPYPFIPFSHFLYATFYQPWTSAAPFGYGYSTLGYVWSVVWLRKERHYFAKSLTICILNAPLIRYIFVYVIMA